ncbi:MAG: helix-turn-helix domain-containing protein [Clostridia bacterium]|nr:helix-turn-helix domain-containing protein [Clostridia bacterium]
MANIHISKLLKEARKAAGYTQKDIYEWLGIGQSTFSAWETGQGEPSVEVFLRLCQKYQVTDIAGYFLPDPVTGKTAERLDPMFVNKMLSLPKRSQDAVRNCLEFEYNNSPLKIHHTERRLRRIPLYTQVATAGFGNYLDDQDAQIRELVAPEEASFAVRISGDSMEPLIHDGDIVFVHRQSEIASGEIGIFSLNGESFCKVWDNRGGVAKLISLNQSYKPIRLTPSDRLLTHGKVLL